MTEILEQGGTLMPDLSLQEILGREVILVGTSISPKIFRYLDFGTASFIFKFIGINKNYLLIIKKFITRFNYNFWLLMN